MTPGLANAARRQMRRVALVVAGFSFASLYFLLWPGDYLIDDAGIVLKYMDNFARGHFFRYNIDDPPVYGISGFIHAIVAGFLAWTGLLSPDHSILASNFLGLALVFCMTALILRQFTDRPALLASACLLVLGGSGFFLITAAQGLETPLHLGIVLSAFYFFSSGRNRLFWLSTGLAVISKLDAVPVMGVLGLLHILRQWPQWRRDRRGMQREWAAILFLGALPVAAFAAFSLVVFDRLLPQSAYAKTAFHPHPEGPVPFLMSWLRVDGLRLGAIFAAIALYAAIRLARREWRRGGESLSFAMSAAALLALYCVYNPGEPMTWYYALPEFLLLLQLAVILLECAEAHLRRMPHWAAIWTAVPVVCFALSMPTVFTLGNYWLTTLNGAEPTRLGAGRWLAEHADPSDRLFTSHGHVARESRLHTYDASGINSRDVTDLWETGADPVKTLRPEWIALEAALTPEAQRSFGYALRKSMYGCARGAFYPAWRIFQRTSETDESWDVIQRIPAERIRVESAGQSARNTPPLEDSGKCLRTRGMSVLVDLRFLENPIGLEFGVSKEDRPFVLAVESLTDEGKALEVLEFHVAAAKPTDSAEQLTQECVARFSQPVAVVLIQMEDRAVLAAAGGFEILDPFAAERWTKAQGRTDVAPVGARDESTQ